MPHPVCHLSNSIWSNSISGVKSSWTSLYRPNSRPVVLTLVALEAVHPPPDGPLEDADIEDEDDCKRHSALFSLSPF